MKNARPSFHVLIPAAGSGTRAGGEIPKQYRQIAGKAVLRHTVEAFLGLPGLSSVRVIVGAGHADLYHASVTGLPLPAPVGGGAERKDSVFNALQSLSDAGNEEVVLIHDAARPLVRRDDILAVARAAADHGAATLAVPVADTLCKSGDDGIDGYVSRDGLWAVQTPQAFRLSLLRAAHEKFKDDPAYTDDTGLVKAMGAEVRLVRGRRGNIKITTEDDFEMAERILESGMETLTGQGFDVHAFALGAAESIRLCGIDVPHDRALLGHSDADVGLHALTDAILGALGDGDIGSHFPPSDARWKGADSAVFLAHARRLAEEKGGRIVHADVTILCEAPKIGPHRDAMRRRIADILGLSPARVGVKATTTEGLGFTGRKEGIAAQAIATLRLPVEH